MSDEDNLRRETLVWLEAEAGRADAHAHLADARGQSHLAEFHRGKAVGLRVALARLEADAR